MVFFLAASCKREDEREDPGNEVGLIFIFNVRERFHSLQGRDVTTWPTSCTFRSVNVRSLCKIARKGKSFF